LRGPDRGQKKSVYQGKETCQEIGKVKIHNNKQGGSDNPVNGLPKDSNLAERATVGSCEDENQAIIEFKCAGAD
jgi:hypothetical protein